MIHPTIQELTYDGKFNRYELALATAKCARKITNEYVRQRDAAEKAMTGNKDTDKPLMNMIDREYRDEKAVKIAINKIHQGEYTIVENAPEEPEFEAPAELESAPAFRFAAHNEDDDNGTDEDKESAEDDLFEDSEFDNDEDIEPSDEELMALEKGDLKID